MTLNYFDILQTELIALLPELNFILSILLVLVFGIITTTSQILGYPLLLTIILGLGLQSLLFCFFLILNSIDIQFDTIVVLGNSFIIDLFGHFSKLLTIVATFSIFLYFRLSSLPNRSFLEFTTLILLTTLSMLFVINSYDLISLYLALELQSLGFYVLASYRRNNEMSIEAGLKYFILGAISSGILLLGESLIYGITGLTNFEEISKFVIDQTSQGYLHVGIALVGISFLFKISAAPFHQWAPDVYEGSPLCVTAYFAIAPKISLLTLLLRFQTCFLDITQLLVLCAVFSMFVGTIGAIHQLRVKRLMAYSGIAHVGIILISISTGTFEAIESLLIYLPIYTFTLINIFSIISSLIAVPVHTPRKSKTTSLVSKEIDQSHPCSKQQSHKHLLTLNSEATASKTTFETIEPYYIKHITDFILISKSNPLIALTAVILFFSNAGIPPLAGFFGKVNVFLTALEGQMYFLALIGILSSVVGAFYSLRLIKIFYFHKLSETRWITYETVDKPNAFLIGITTLFTLFFCIWPSSLFLLVHLMTCNILF